MHHADQTVAKGRADTRYKPDTKEPLLFARPSSRRKATGLYIMGYVNPKGARRDTSPQGLITAPLSGAHTARRVTGRKARRRPCWATLRRHPRKSAAACPSEEAIPPAASQGERLGARLPAANSRNKTRHRSLTLHAKPKDLTPSPLGTSSSRLSACPDRYPTGGRPHLYMLPDPFSPFCFAPTFSLKRF